MTPRAFRPAIVGFTVALVLSLAGAPSCVLAQDGKRGAVVATSPDKARGPSAPAPPLIARPPEDAGAEAIELINVTAAGPDDVALAGLPEGSKPVRLTWERIYQLAAIRARSRDRAVPLETVDPTALAARTQELGVAGIEGLRRLFLEDGSFDDPAPSVLELLRDSQLIKFASKKVARSEMLVRLFRQLADGESSGLTQNQLDQIDIMSHKDRLVFTDRLTQYRDRLDELKVALGIAVHAPIVLDTTPFAPFSEAFSLYDRWQLDSNRRFNDIPIIAKQLPPLEDLVIEGRSLLALTRVDVDRPEGFCQAAVQIAQRHARAAPAAHADREVLIRGTIRGMIRDARTYDLARAQFAPLMKQSDHVFEELINPANSAGGGAVARLALTAMKLHTAQDGIGSHRESLVTLWSRYQTSRIRMQRFLGAFPFSDWAAFERSLNPKPIVKLEQLDQR